MDKQPLHDALDAQYFGLAERLEGFQPREGQLQMLHAIADTLAEADFDPANPPQPKVAVIEAGTGVGKTRAYLLAGLHLARLRKVKLLISTATIALQEQLMHKDLPELAKASTEPFSYAMLKGRGRYVCLLKLDAQASGQAQESFDLSEPAQQGAAEADAAVFQKLQRKLQSGAWDGERDSLDGEALAGWSRIAADRHACTGPACEQYQDCLYYGAKRVAAAADVLVANHDLVLASLRSDKSALPSGERAIYVFDEGHHLPAIALSHGASETTLTSTAWATRLERALSVAASELDYPAEALPDGLGVLREKLAQLARALMDAHTARLQSHAADGSTEPLRVRLTQGKLSDELRGFWEELHQVASVAESKLADLSTWMRRKRSDDGDSAAQVNAHLLAIGPQARRLTELVETAELMLDEGPMPPAKWFDFRAEGGVVQLDAKACPLFAGALLQRNLWSRLRGAVVTSATLRALGKFDFFLRDAGLEQVEGARTLEVQSPFDYARQGRFIVVATQSSPKDPAAHNRECGTLIAQDLREVQHGALLLCSSWVQLRALVDAMPPEIRNDLLVQGSASREQLLRRHREAVARGQRSVLVGLQSFGEGLDLPGTQCEWVLMPKVPFANPSDPVSEARSEWLEAKGRNSFVELTVPATGVRLNQWAGRGIRSEQDRATLVCYDPRLATTPFGRQLLAGLPPFSKRLRRGGKETGLEEGGG
jgi:ATP-dependent DNA helicase DinG